MMKRLFVALVLMVILSLSILAPMKFANAHTSTATDGSMSDYASRSGFVYASPTIKYLCSDPAWKNETGFPLGGDTDGDGICDSWETPRGLVVSLQSNGPIPAAGTPLHYEYLCTAGGGPDPDCPNPNRPDIYVELDWMTDSANSHVPLAGVIQNVKNSFLNAPVGSAPNTGIVLHVQNGETTNSGDILWHKNSLYTNWSNQAAYPGLYRIKQYYFGTVAERNGQTVPALTGGYTPKWTPNFPDETIKRKLTAKFEVFHYAMIINKRTEDVYSSGWAEPGGNDVVISLGGFDPIMGSQDHQQGTFMHELGHNLGLQHGGSDGSNYKPNYVSIMSYTFQFAETYDACRPLDYMNGLLTTLGESTGMDETTGLQNVGGGSGYTYPASPSCSKLVNGVWEDVAGHQRFIYYNKTVGNNPNMLEGVGRVTQAVDWDGSGSASSASAIADVNSDSVKNSLGSRDDWDIPTLTFKFISNSFASGSSAGSSQSQSVTLSEDHTDDTGIDEIYWGDDSAGAAQEFNYQTLKNIRFGHLRILSNEILSQSNDSFKGGYEGKQKVHQYVANALVFVENDNVKNAYKSLLELQKLIDDKGSNLIIDEDVKKEISNLLKDKVQTFAIAQNGPEIPPSGHVTLDDLASQLNDLSASLNDVRSSVSSMGQKLGSIEQKIDSMGEDGGGTTSQLIYVIIGLIIAIIAGAIALIFRRHK